MRVAILQARVFATRLPGKVLKPLIGKSMLSRIIERIRRANTLDDLVVATSKDSADDPIAEECNREGVLCFRGCPEDVLDRFYQCARYYDAKHVIRITSDCPFLDPAVIDQVVDCHMNDQNDYTSNVIRRTFPDGLDTEVVSMETLETVWRLAKSRCQREHVTRFILEHPERFKTGNFEGPLDVFQLRWTVDRPEDLKFTRMVYGELYPSNPEFTWTDVLDLVRSRPDITSTNAACGIARATRGRRRLDGR